MATNHTLNIADVPTRYFTNGPIQNITDIPTINFINVLSMIITVVPTSV